MNREIKFRGINRDGKFYTGHYCKDYLGVHYITAIDGSWTVSIDGDTLGQFTGHLDINGIEIYEGDIVTYGRCKEQSQISWNNSFAGFLPFLYATYHPLCIIGNIHQNPELLNK